MIVILNYGSYARAINSGMRPGKNRTKIGQTLTEFITEEPYIINREGRQFNITSRETSAWWNYGALPEGITEAATDARIVKKAPKFFEKYVIGELLPKDTAQVAYDEIKNLVANDTSIAADLQKHLLELYKKEAWADFLAETFLLALQRPNTEEMMGQPLADAVDELMEALKKLPKPSLITPPTEIDANLEMNYVSQTIAAYAEAEGLPRLTREDLKQERFSKYDRHFVRQRNDFYAAISVERSVRDDLRLCEMNAFNDFISGVKNIAQDWCDDDYDNGFERMKTVLRQVGSMGPTGSILDSIPGWIGPAQKKGGCHVLVNDGQLRWCDGK